MKFQFQPLDRVAIIVSLLLAIVTGMLLLQGDRTAPQVREFSWANQEVTATNTKFSITFNRAMEQESVEQNLQIFPKLKGKFSWAGRQMSYTLTQPISYGQKFTIGLTNAFDRFIGTTALIPFKSNFSSPDRVLVYIGNQGDERGRLVIYNLSTNDRKLLTPSNQTVIDFKPYPDRKHILYSATPKTDRINIIDQELFKVTTGIDNTPGQTEKVLDNREYQIFKFDLSPDGDRIVVQRLSRSVQGSYGLWQIKDGEITALSQPPGGEFIIAPDNTSLAITQGEGVAILSLETNAEPLDFLPKFGNILSFNAEGSQAAMVKFNKDYTRSLFIVNNQGEEQELITINGSILYSQFDFTNKFLYTLLTKVEQTANTYQEHPYLARINIPDGQIQTLVELKGQRNIRPSLAPDDSAIVFAVTEPDRGEVIYQLTIGDQVTSESLKSLQISGLSPKWLL